MRKKIHKISTALDIYIYNILLESLNQFHGANLALSSDVDQDTFGKVTKHKKHKIHDSQEVSPFPAGDHKALRNRHDTI